MCSVGFTEFLKHHEGAGKLSRSVYFIMVMCYGYLHLLAVFSFLDLHFYVS
jgi:hypothetical protein